jgi:hypothetical protein
MGWDSNPRYAFDVYALSRRAPSTARPPIRTELVIVLPTVPHGKRRVLMQQWSDFCGHPAWP